MLSPVSLASSDQDGGPSDSTIHIYEHWADTGFMLIPVTILDIRLNYDYYYDDESEDGPGRLKEATGRPYQRGRRSLTLGLSVSKVLC